MCHDWQRLVTCQAAQTTHPHPDLSPAPWGPLSRAILGWEGPQLSAAECKVAPTPPFPEGCSLRVWATRQPLLFSRSPHSPHDSAERLETPEKNDSPTPSKSLTPWLPRPPLFPDAFPDSWRPIRVMPTCLMRSLPQTASSSALWGPDRAPSVETHQSLGTWSVAPRPDLAVGP